MRKRKVPLVRGITFVAVILAMIMSTGCTALGVKTKSSSSTSTATSVTKKGSIILATTTSTQDSGLLEVILPVFTRETGYEVKTVAVGTGAAIQMGVDGEADVLLVHDKTSELAYMKNGDGISRSDVMYNDFILVGDASDPAGIKASSPNDIVASLKTISTKQAKFISRGDNSGTHKAELKLWKAAGITPTGTWYVSASTGMGAVLQMAEQTKGYTISDRATYLSNTGKLKLVIVCEKDTSGKLFNQYGVITVNPNKNTKINAKGGQAFYDWIISAKTQKFIGEYGVAKYGQPLFIPNAK